MAKVKMKRHGYHLDMTPMVDVGFLLLTFFMLTAKFKSDTDEKLTISLPKADTTMTKLPDKDLALLTIGLKQNEGGAPPDTVMYYSVVNEKDRAAIYKPLGLSSIKNPGQAAADDELSKIGQVRVDRAALERVVRQSRLQNASMRYAITADSSINYGTIDDIMRVMQKLGATRFNLATTGEAKSFPTK